MTKVIINLIINKYMETLGDDPKLMICKITVLPIKLYSLSIL